MSKEVEEAIKQLLRLRMVIGERKDNAEKMSIEELIHEKDIKAIDTVLAELEKIKTSQSK